MANKLNERQLEAVQTVEGPLLIIAGAGSGKTTVIVNRIAYMISHCGINPWNILAKMCRRDSYLDVCRILHLHRM